jgi:2-oxoisovalerate dehydrogenase E2 component (dihydrolipoyl transacylase)
MATRILVPRLGEGVDELTVVKWLKKTGDPVKELEPLVEVETDKVVTEIPSPAAGILLLSAIPENTQVQVGMILGWIGQAGESIPDTETTASQTHKLTSSRSMLAPQEAPMEVVQHKRSAFLSPIVRKLANEHQIDLSKILGTGLEGRITKNDLLAIIECRGNITEQSPLGSILPISSLRKQIAERMVNSRKISPHVLTVMEADLTAVNAHRMVNKPILAAQGVNLTYTAYFIAAICSALKANPLVNSSWTDVGIRMHEDINIGMATSLGEEGLIVPVIHRADGLSLQQIAHQVNNMAARARSKKLLPEEVKGGTFTLTNHGISGSLFAMPIINQPQTGILGVGAIQKRPVVVSDSGVDAIAIKLMVYLSFVFDHRILDGSSADAFLSRVKQALESWK